MQLRKPTHIAHTHAFTKNSYIANLLQTQTHKQVQTASSIYKAIRTCRTPTTKSLAPVVYKCMATTNVYTQQRRNMYNFSKPCSRYKEPSEAKQYMQEYGAP